MQARHGVLGQQLGLVVHVGDEVVDVVAMRLHRAQVGFNGWWPLLGVADPEEPLGPRVVEVLGVHVLQEALLTAALGRILLYLRPLHFDVLPVVRAEGDGEEGRGDHGRDGGERQGNRGARHGGGELTHRLALGEHWAHTHTTQTLQSLMMKYP